MTRLITALIIGAVFGIGLAIAGMLNPSKVVGFLDVFGDWDPSLAFVMVITVSAALTALALTH